MEIRDAVEADAGRLSALADPPTDVMRNLIHDRTVRVAEAERSGPPGDEADATGESAGVEGDGASEPPRGDGNGAGGTGERDSPEAGGIGDRDGDRSGDRQDPGTDRGRVPAEQGEILGFVSFDVRDSTVHVTQIEGTAEACEHLLDEPVTFARREGMDVEMLVPETESAAGEAAQSAGFRNAGNGPRFEGTATVRYRYDPAGVEESAGGLSDS